MSKGPARWHLTASTDKIRLVRERRGSRIELQVPAPWENFILAEDTEPFAHARFQEAVNVLRKILDSHARLPTVYEGKIIWSWLEIEAPKIKSKGDAQRRAVRRRTRTALDAIQDYLDST